MIADWTIKPKKRENRFAEVAGLPRVAMPPRLCHLMKDDALVPLDRPMIMRHLMASSAGFAFGPAFGSTNLKVDELYAKADLWSGTNDDIIPKLAKLPLESQPGTEFRYGLQQEVQSAMLAAAVAIIVG
jgi:hypothetical protein